MSILVGCPVKNREWILPAWHQSLSDAMDVAGVHWDLMMLCGTSSDKTHLLVEGMAHFRMEEHEQPDVMPAIPGDTRVWNIDRYAHMVEIRNRLLRKAREIRPAYYLSLDTDILLHPAAIRNLLETADESRPYSAAVGGKCYMTPPPATMFPSYAHISGANGLMRPDSMSTFDVDVLMAIKLMKPAAYNVDYSMDFHGEDIGWSKNVTAAGGKLVWDGRVCSKHVMSPEWLSKVDPRVGF